MQICNKGKTSGGTSYIWHSLLSTAQAQAFSKSHSCECQVCHSFVESIRQNQGAVPVVGCNARREPREFKEGEFSQLRTCLLYSINNQVLKKPTAGNTPGFSNNCLSACNASLGLWPASEQKVLLVRFLPQLPSCCLYAGSCSGWASQKRSCYGSEASHRDFMACRLLQPEKRLGKLWYLEKISFPKKNGTTK